MSLTRKKTITGVFIIIVGIALSSLGFALASQTPETVNEETDDWWEGFALWSQNVGITFAKGFGTGLYYLGFIVIGGGAFALFYWQFKS